MRLGHHDVEIGVGVDAVPTDVPDVVGDLPAHDPCIGVRSKQAATIGAYLATLGWTPAQIAAAGLQVGYNPLVTAAVLVGITVLFGGLAIRRLARSG